MMPAAQWLYVVGVLEELLRKLEDPVPPKKEKFKSAAGSIN